MVEEVAEMGACRVEAELAAVGMEEVATAVGGVGAVGEAAAMVVVQEVVDYQVG